MPPMPPLNKNATQEEKVPDAVNFEMEGAEEKEVAIVGGIEVNRDAEGKQINISPPKEGHSDPVDRDGSPSPATETNASASASKQQGHRPALFQDPKAIASLATPVERSKAYIDLRDHISRQPNELQKWLQYQMEHNNGQHLMETKIVDVRPGVAGPRKTKSRMHLHTLSQGGGQGSSNGNGNAGQAPPPPPPPPGFEESGSGKEKLKAGALKVGGWMKKVTQKV